MKHLNVVTGPPEETEVLAEARRRVADRYNPLLTAEILAGGWDRGRLVQDEVSSILASRHPQ